MKQVSLKSTGFFSKFLMVGTQQFWSPSVPDGDDVGWGGDLQKNLTQAKTAHLMQNKQFFGHFKHEIRLFKAFLSLKVVKFDTKMYSNFSNLRGRTSAGRGRGMGQALVQKRGQVSNGGMTKSL